MKHESKTITDSDLAQTRLIRLVIILILVGGLGIIPMKIISMGYMPVDDALRHSAKVVSGKEWKDILVIREDVKMDSHPGWHTILNAVHKTTGCNTSDLVNFSVIGLFILFILVPIFFIERPEAWLITLFSFVVIGAGYFNRILSGRPYIVTMAIVLVIFFLWPKLRNKKVHYGTFIAIVLLMAISTWVHCAWYLLALPIMSLFLAREWRAAILIAIATFIGVIIGASFTGHPYLFLKQTFLHLIHAFGSHNYQRVLVSEFQSGNGYYSTTMFVLVMLIWRKLRGSWNIKVIDNPVFIMAVLCWVFSYISTRFWIDWGFPALMIWTLFEFQDFLKSKIKEFSWKRCLLTICLFLSFYLAITNDIGSRWTKSLLNEYLDMKNPDHATFLPDHGGIVYSDSMSIFYQTFFKNPHAPWRYVLGFEPAIMAPDDLKIFRKIQYNFSDYKAFEPWVEKMKPEDRLIINHTVDAAPKIDGLEWKQVISGTWIGRVSKKTNKEELK